MNEHGWIDTLEGGHIVCPADWIITGVKGEHYPCKPDIFEATLRSCVLHRVMICGVSIANPEIPSVTTIATLVAAERPDG